jgi:hypothetical protein
MMVLNPMLFAIETFPLIVFIFMGLVVLSVPAFWAWEKYVQPMYATEDEDEEEEEVEEGMEVAAGAEPVFPEGGGSAEEADLAGLEAADVAEGAEVMGGAELDGDAAEQLQAEIDLAAQQEEDGDAAFEEALPDEMFVEDEGEKPSA